MPSPAEDPYLYNEATLRDVLHFVRLIAHNQSKMEKLMSDLTDQVDVALATLAQDVLDAQGRFDAAVAAQTAAIAVLQAQTDAAVAGEAVDAAELQKALDAITAANAALAALGQPPVTP